MSEVKQKIAYLQGLSAGINLDKESKEGKILGAVVDILEAMTEEIEKLRKDREELEKYVEAVDEDLGELEDEVYGNECDCDECEDDEDDEDYDSDDYFEDGDLESEDEGSFVEMECPQCHDIVKFETSLLEDEDVIEITCPNCDEVVYVNDDEAVMEKKEKE